MNTKNTNLTNETIFIIDDDPAMGSMLADFLNSQKYNSRVFTSALEALNQIDDNTSLVITDLKMPQMDGLTFIKAAQEKFPHLAIILVTAFGSIETAIEATRAGAFHFLTKPLKLNELLVYTEKALHFRNLKKHNTLLKGQAVTQYSFAGIIGKSQEMKHVFDLIARVAPAHANVLIQGDSGTGKELVARALHQLSPRKDKPFVAINCTAIPDTLLESELFGHAKGSFTGAVQKKKGLFEEADGGTLFLDEIGDLELGLQAKLLRVLQERRIRAVGENSDKQVDVRIVTATHKNLKEAIHQGRFREDFYYRLSVIPITLPPLRHRREDIPLLAVHFLEKYSVINERPLQGFSAAAMEQLMTAEWEGNIRELENVIERAVVLCKAKQIEQSDLPQETATTSENIFAKSTLQLPTLQEFEKKYIQFILNKVGGKKEKAAHILGINRRTLYRKEIEYGWETHTDSDDSDAK